MSRAFLLAVVLLLALGANSAKKTQPEPAKVDEATLLKDILGEGTDGGKPRSQEREYEPTMEYDDDSADLGQAEVGDLADELLEEEKAYFYTRDHDGDGMLSKQEFLRQLNDIVDPIIQSGRPPSQAPPLPPGITLSDSLSGGGGDAQGSSAGLEAPPKVVKSAADTKQLLADRKNPLPGRDALMYGKDWTSRIPDSQGEKAFLEFDTDKDGKVSWNEWSNKMFHEQPQMPRFRDGKKATIIDPSGLRDDEVNPEDIVRMKALFQEFDEDKSGELDQDEVTTLLKKTRAAAAAAQAGDGPALIGEDNDLTAIAAEMVVRMDKNNDTTLTIKEWVDGGGY